MKYAIIEAEIIEWLKAYEGEKFHAILSDPPYALISIAKRFGPGQVEAQESVDGRFSRLGKGFMGQTWDGFDSLEDYQKWVAEWAKLMIEKVLYPGALCLFFGGTRTWHHLAVGLENGGFEIYDSLMWLYGCISEDTEILTPDGWKCYKEAVSSNAILCYGVEDDTFHWEKPSRFYVYEYDDTAFRIDGDTTSQLVSRNHRCLVEQDGKLLFEVAEKLARQSQIRIPILEDVRRLQEAVSDVQFHTSLAQQTLLELRSFETTAITQKKTSRRTGGDGRNNLLFLWQKTLQASFTGQEVEKKLLQSSMQWKSERTGINKTFPQVLCGANRGIEAVTIREDDWLQQPSVERRGYDTQSQGQSWPAENQIYEMPAGFLINGTQRRLCDGASNFGCPSYRQTTTKDGSCTSQEPQCGGQQAGESRVIPQQPGPQAIRASRFATAHLARITPVHYRGIMWCPTVSTGAFVARRKGQIFITGNSGFPKSHDISKGIDKAAGADREIIGKRKHPTLKDQSKVDEKADAAHGDNLWVREWDLTEPATDGAKSWDGYGTALKPSWEPIILCRAPRKGQTFASLALEFGSGALNIDGGRIAHSEESKPMKSQGGGNKVYAQSGRYKETLELKPEGRWPANLILSHHEDCQLLGDIITPGRVINRWKEGMKPFGDGAGEPFESEQFPPETIERWACVAECPIRQLDDQAGISRSGNKIIKRETGKGHQGATFGVESRPAGTEMHAYGDSGFVSRFFYCGKASRAEKDAGLETFFWKRVDRGYERITENEWLTLDRKKRAKFNIHPTVKPLSLLQYLSTLILPPKIEDDRRIFIPFSGSGSEIIGSLKAGWDLAVGVEAEAQYNEIAVARIKHNLGMFLVEAKEEHHGKDKAEEDNVEVGGEDTPL